MKETQLWMLMTAMKIGSNGGFTIIIHLYADRYGETKSNIRRKKTMDVMVEMFERWHSNSILLVLHDSEQEKLYFEECFKRYNVEKNILFS